MLCTALVMSRSSPRPFSSHGGSENPSSPMTPEHHKESPLMTSQSFSEEHQELVFRAPRGDSGIGDTLPEPLQLQRVNETADIAFEMSFDGSIASIPSVLSSPGRSCAAAKCSLVSSYSTEPLSSDHEHSAFSNSDTAAGEGGGDRSSPDIEADGAREQDSKQGGKKRKHSLKHLVEEQASTNGFRFTTPTYKWFIALPNAYRLNGSKCLKVKEEVTECSKHKKNKKLELELKIYPNYTETSNERVTKMRVKLNVKNAPLQTLCTAVVGILLRGDAGEIVLQKQEERKFSDNYIQFFTTLGSQELIERFVNKTLDIRVEVDLQFQRADMSKHVMQAAHDCSP